MSTDAASLANAMKIASVADTFLHAYCFVCRDVLCPDNPETHDVPAEHLWIGAAPKFLAVLLCDAHLRQWLAEAYVTADAHHWPTTRIPLQRGGD